VLALALYELLIISGLLGWESVQNLARSVHQSVIQAVNQSNAPSLLPNQFVVHIPIAWSFCFWCLGVSIMAGFMICIKNRLPILSLLLPFVCPISFSSLSRFFFCLLCLPDI